MGTKENHAPYSHVVYSDEHADAIVIPYSSIKELGFAQCKQPKQTVKAWYNDQEVKPDIVINGGLFNMSTGKNILSFTDNGVEQNYRNGFEGFGITADDKTLVVFGKDNSQTWYDFMSAYPVLVREGKALTKFDNANEINGKYARQAIGITQDNDLIIITADKPVNSGAGLTFEELSKMFVELGAYYAIGLDGGGSVYRMEYGEVTNSPTETRKVDNMFYVILKTYDEVKDEMITAGSVMYAAKEIEVYTGIETGKVNYTIPVGAEVAIRTPINHWNDKDWVCVCYDYQVGYMVYENDNLVTEPVSSDNNDKATDADTKYVELDTPTKYMVIASNGLNIRDDHSTNGKIVGSVECDMVVIIDGIYDNAWAHIRYIDVDDPSKYITGDSSDLWTSIKYLKVVEESAPSDSSDKSDDTNSSAEGSNVTFDYPIKVVALKPGNVVLNGKVTLKFSTYALFRVVKEVTETGEYVLTQDLVTDGNSIIITANKDEFIELGTLYGPTVNDTDVDENAPAKKSDTSTVDVLDSFTDKNEISDWAVDAMRTCVKKGYFVGNDGKLDPKGTITKEALATVIARMI